MEARVQAKYIRMSPRKIRLVVDLIRGLSVEKAMTQLQFLNKSATRPLLKLLMSAIDSAKNKKMQEEKLYVKTITVDAGPTLKRSRPRAFGRATPIRKRSSHITVVLGEK